MAWNSIEASTFPEDISCATCYLGIALLQTAEPFRFRYKNFLCETAYTTYLIAVRLIRLMGVTGMFSIRTQMCWKYRLHSVKC
jgi:hypothetical protein